MQILNYTAVIEFDEDAKVYVGHFPALPEAITEAASLDELSANLHEVLELALEVRAAHSEPIVIDSFVGTQRVTVTV